MAYGNKAYTVQESTNPHFKGVVGTSSINSETPSKAIVNNGTADSVNLTYADGTVVALYMLQGVLYPISITASSASLLYLY
tara:strand:- start:1181 stop:1423 length:243 start_codon:yes stop_codon:yes gene_type:complete